MDVQSALQGYLEAVPPGLTKHARLREALVRAIGDGLWGGETRLPTEQELTELTPFSLGTVQRAIRSLVEEGRIERIKGRGSFVNDMPRGIDQPFLHVRFLDGDGGENETYLPIFPKVLSRKRIAERGPWSEHLGQQGNNILRIERTMTAGNEFATYALFYINAERYPAFAALSAKELSAGNFKLMLAREYNLPPIVYRHTLQLAALPAAATRTLKLKAGTIGGIFRMTTHAGQRPLYYQEIFVPPNGRQMRLPDMMLPTGR